MKVLECLNWDLKIVEQNLEKIASQGFDCIQITPVQPLKEDHKNNWWLCYQPCGFTIGNQYGSKKDLISLCKVAQYYNIKIILDVICTHVAQGKHLEFHERVDKSLTENPHFWREKRSIQYGWEYDNRYNVTHYCAGGLPGFNLYNWDLQDKIAEFLNECIDCGVSGFRFDSGKSIPLPSDCFYEHQKDARPCDFFPRVLTKLDRHDLENYIEVLNVSKELILAYSKYGKVLTDVEYLDIDPNILVTYVESHDQYYNWRHNVVSPYSDETITDWYDKKTNFYPNTMYFSRPFSNEWQSERVKYANKKKVYR